MVIIVIVLLIAAITVDLRVSWQRAAGFDSHVADALDLFLFEVPDGD